MPPPRQRVTGSATRGFRRDLRLPRRSRVRTDERRRTWSSRAGGVSRQDCLAPPSPDLNNKTRTPSGHPTKIASPNRGVTTTTTTTTTMTTTTTTITTTTTTSTTMMTMTMTVVMMTTVTTTTTTMMMMPMTTVITMLTMMTMMPTSMRRARREQRRRRELRRVCHFLLRRRGRRAARAPHAAHALWPRPRGVVCGATTTVLSPSVAARSLPGAARRVCCVEPRAAPRAATRILLSLAAAVGRRLFAATAWSLFGTAWRGACGAKWCACVLQPARPRLSIAPRT